VLAAQTLDAGTVPSEVLARVRAAMLFALGFDR